MQIKRIIHGYKYLYIADLCFIFGINFLICQKTNENLTALWMHVATRYYTLATIFDISNEINMFIDLTNKTTPIWLFSICVQRAYTYVVSKSGCHLAIQFVVLTK